MKSFAGIILLIVFVSGSADAADRVRMSISAVDVSFLTAGLALKRGIFRDEVERPARSRPPQQDRAVAPVHLQQAVAEHLEPAHETRLLGDRVGRGAHGNGKQRPAVLHVIMMRTAFRGVTGSPSASAGRAGRGARGRGFQGRAASPVPTGAEAPRRFQRPRPRRPMLL